VTEAESTSASKFWAAVGVSVVAGTIMLFVQNSGIMNKEERDAIKRPHYDKSLYNGLAAPDEVVDMTLVKYLYISNHGNKFYNKESLKVSSYVIDAIGPIQEQTLKLRKQDLIKEYEYRFKQKYSEKTVMSKFAELALLTMKDMQVQKTQKKGDDSYSSVVAKQKAP
jgi:hypothetical protein